jgi:hypothetical protein
MPLQYPGSAGDQCYFHPWIVLMFSAKFDNNGEEEVLKMRFSVFRWQNVVNIYTRLQTQDGVECAYCL